MGARAHTPRSAGVPDGALMFKGITSAQGHADLPQQLSACSNSSSSMKLTGPSRARLPDSSWH